MKTNTIANIRVGKPDVSAATPSHVQGVREGNELGSARRQSDIEPEGLTAKGTSRRSTGINAKARAPIDPDMPNLSPP
jgi:hypothetical protein